MEVEIVNVSLSGFLVDGDVVVCLPKCLAVQLLKILLQLFEGTLLQNSVAIEIDDSQESSLYHIKRASLRQFLPHEHQVTEIENPHEDTEQRLTACELNYDLYMGNFLLTVLLPLLQQQILLPFNQNFLIIFFQEVYFS